MQATMLESKQSSERGEAQKKAEQEARPPIYWSQKESSF